LEDVILQRVLAKGEEKLLTPLGVAAGVDIEGDEDEAPDILHGDGLGMQIEEGGNLMQKEGAMEVVGTVAGRRHRSICVIASGVVDDGGRSLALVGGVIQGGPGTGGRVIALLGGGGSLLFRLLGASKGGIALGETRLALLLLLQACGFGLLLARSLGSGGGAGYQAATAWGAVQDGGRDVRESHA
jgi:hypothetical protein